MQAPITNPFQKFIVLSGQILVIQTHNTIINEKV